MLDSQNVSGETERPEKEALVKETLGNVQKYMKHLNAIQKGANRNYYQQVCKLLMHTYCISIYKLFKRKIVQSVSRKLFP